MQKSLDLVRARVRRDAHATTPVTVLAHELPILYEIYGRENVTVGDAVERAHAIDAQGEYQRLANKYGLTIVEEVYGRESSGRLTDAIRRAAAAGSGEEDEQDQTAPVAKRRGRRPAPALLDDDEAVTE